MTRARWLLSVASLFALWLIGVLFCLPHMQRDLKAAALEALSQQPDLNKRLDGLDLVFDGLQAHLSGSVRTPQERDNIASAVENQVQVRTPLTGSLGRHLNPVSHVQNEIEVIPFPPGWLMLAAKGEHARLLGTTANEYEARDLAHSVQENWSTQGGKTEGTPDTNTDQHDEAASVSATLRTVPAPQSGVQAYLARIGQPWAELSLSKSDAELLAEARTQGVTEIEWQQQVLPALHELRATLQQQMLAQAEKERSDRLPAGYLFIAVRGQEIILCGEVGSTAMKSAVLEDALTVFEPRRLHDEIRVSVLRRPSGDFGPITTALLPEDDKTAAKSCFLSLSGEAWKEVDWQTAASEQAWKQGLPAGLDAKPLQNDSAMLNHWLAGDDSHSPHPSQSMEPAFLALALFGTKAIVSGQIAEEAARAQFIAAVRQAYSPPLLVISDAVQVRGNCEPSSNILQTLKSLPPAPAASSVGVFAIAKPGSTWTLIPVTRELVEAGGLAKSSLLPAGVPAAVVEDLAAESIEQLRLHLAPPALR